MYVATPGLLDANGVDLGSLDPSIEFISAEVGNDVGLLGVAQEQEEGYERTAVPLTGAEAIEPTYSSLPSTFVTADALEQRGWEAVPSGRWLVVPSSPPSHEQLAAARRPRRQSSGSPSSSATTRPACRACARAPQRSGCSWPSACWP